MAVLLFCSSPLLFVSGKPCRYGKSLRPLLRYLSPDTRSRRSKKPRVEGTTVGSAMSHSSAVEQLYAWEKKLYMEVKDEERFREERRKRVSQVRKQEVKGVDNAKVQKNRKDIERLESKMAVASQAMETICIEIMRLRESELYPLLLELLNGLKAMWRSMYEYHHVQTHIAQQLEYLTTATTITGSAANATASGLRGKLTHELELAVKRWHSALGALVGSQREYIHAIAGWLRLSFFRFHRVPLSRTQQDSDIYALCEEWQLTLDKLPDKEASEAVKSLLTAVHAIVLRQEEEDRERRRWESAVKAVEKKTAELTALEDGRCPRSAPEDGEATVQWSPLSAKRAKVEVLRAGAEEEKAKYEKSASVTREITLSSLQRELPNVFQAMMAFSGACIEAFEAVHDHHRGDLDRARSLKMLLRP
ncbi:hypothetical protein Taro_044542 [Colocasia esculenta]|uniref:DUF632 domain-containing protein n=1 Tax=Colocasia esculenta TaxID=4460 RepID=A0A843WUU8_COLES|nr:hypothetical protein [Colocasia esculenta]